MSMDIFSTLKRLQRLPRSKRIFHLQTLVLMEKPRSVRRQELQVALKREMTAQLKAENRAA